MASWTGPSRTFQKGSCLVTKRIKGRRCELLAIEATHSGVKELSSIHASAGEATTTTVAAKRVCADWRTARAAAFAKEGAKPAATHAASKGANSGTNNLWQPGA